MHNEKQTTANYFCSKSLMDVKEGTSSEPTRHEQYARMVQVNSELEAFETAAMRVVDNDNYYPPYIRLVIFVLLRTGARVSEVLNASYNIQERLLIVKFKGLKGSRDRVEQLFIPSSLRSITSIMIKSTFHRINRHYIYRLCERESLYFNVKGNDKRAVTHSFRYNYIKRLESASCTTSEIQQLVGHKRITSTLEYVKEIKR